MGTVLKAKFEKKSGTKFVDIKRRSRDLTRLFGRLATAKDPEDRIVKRMAGMVVSEATWLVEILSGAKLNAEDAGRFKDIQKHLAEVHEAWEDEIRENKFIPETPARIVPDLAWLVAKVEELKMTPQNERVAEPVLEDDGEDL